MKLTVDKRVPFHGLKQATSSPTPGQLALINKFTRREFTADELYVGQLWLANNAIDRDNERFSEDLLKVFADTAVRKSMMLNHDRKVQSVAGKFFEVEILKLTPEEFKAATGEEPMLPEGVDKVHVLAPWFYTAKAAVEPQLIEKIDAGMIDFASIGFSADARVPVTDKDGKTLYREYRGAAPTSEMREGSLVYLGAQFGAQIKSSMDAKDEKEEVDMDILKTAGTFLGKEFGTGDALLAEIKSMAKQLSDALASADGLKAMAEVGKKYKDSICTKYVELKAKLGEVDEKAESRDQLKKYAEGFDPGFIEGEIKNLQSRVYEKFPAEAQLSGGDPQKERDQSTSTSSGKAADGPVLAGAKKAKEKAEEARKK